jgi:hypothetical protein
MYYVTLSIVTSLQNLYILSPLIQLIIHNGMDDFEK